MGLDITYYSRLSLLDAVFDSYGEPIDPATRQPIERCFQAFVNPGFQDRADAIQDQTVYLYDKRDSFRAGSYSGYNQWREQLAALAGYPAVDREQYGEVTKRHDAGAWRAEGGPFWELINFSDCEGVIGPETSAKLAKDFAEYQGRADAHPDEYWREKYAEWRKAFETAAATNGAVAFH